jgi:hypothetical protein
VEIDQIMCTTLFANRFLHFLNQIRSFRDPGGRTQVTYSVDRRCMGWAYDVYILGISQKERDGRDLCTAANKPKYKSPWTPRMASFYLIWVSKLTPPICTQLRALGISYLPSFYIHYIDGKPLTNLDVLLKCRSSPSCAI